MADNAMLLEAGPRGPRFGGKHGDGAGKWRERLAALFPEAEASNSGVTGPDAGDAPSRRPWRRTVSVAVQVAVVGAAAGALLLRVAGVPAWDGTYAEDNGVFLVDGLVRPWHLLVPYSAVVAGDRQVRLFAVTALLTGFVQTTFDATISQYVVFQQPTPTFMAAARYSTIPVLLFAATGIAAVDSYVRRHGARSLVAACVLACVLGFGWVTDFRYVSQRTNAGRWLPYAQTLVTACRQDPAGDVTLNAWGGHKFTVTWARIRR